MEKKFLLIIFLAVLLIINCSCSETNEKNTYHSKKYNNEFSNYENHYFPTNSDYSEIIHFDDEISLLFSQDIYLKYKNYLSLVKSKDKITGTPNTKVNSSNSWYKIEKITREDINKQYIIVTETFPKASGVSVSTWIYKVNEKIELIAYIDANPDSEFTPNAFANNISDKFVNIYFKDLNSERLLNITNEKLTAENIEEYLANSDNVIDISTIVSCYVKDKAKNSDDRIIFERIVYIPYRHFKLSKINLYYCLDDNNLILVDAKFNK